MIYHHGKHSMMDIHGFFKSPKDGGEWMLGLMRQSLKMSSCREVHHKLVILGEDDKSPPGFTCVVLIDESHLTSHCYSDRGMLAIDVFTCGTGSDPDDLMDQIWNSIQYELPNVECISRKTLGRFPYTATICQKPT